MRDDPGEPMDLPDDGPPRRRSRPKKPPVPPGIEFTVYGLTGGAAILILLPCVWLFAVPAAAFSLAACLYLPSRYRSTYGLAACAIVSGLVLFAGLAIFMETGFQLRKAGLIE